MRRFRQWIALLVALELAAAPAWAAVTANSLVSPQVPNRGIAQITPSNGQSMVVAAVGASVACTGVCPVAYTCATTGGAASKITAIWATSTDTAAQVVQVLIVNTSKVYPILSVSVPAASGTAAAGGTPMVNLLSAANVPGLSTDSDGNPYLTCVGGDTIVVGTVGTITANKFIGVVVNAADF